MPYFRASGQHIAETLRFNDFQTVAVRHLVFLKVRNFNCWHGSEGEYAPSCQILCQSVESFRRYGRFSIFQDGSRPPSWIFLMSMDHPHIVFSGLYHCAKFGWNRCSSFNNMLVLTFSRVKLEKAYSRPQNIFGRI